MNKKIVKIEKIKICVKTRKFAKQRVKIRAKIKLKNNLKII